MHLKYLTSAVIFFQFTAAQSAVSTITQNLPQPTPEPEWDSDDTFTSAVLNSTNHYREQHNASDVSWNETLADFAEEYLDGMEDCDWEHSDGPYGENLAKGYPNVTRSVEAWGDERDDYDFDDAEFSEETGHFTQLVWKNTTDVGCARKLCNDNAWYLVCEYWPRGNVLGQFEYSVDEKVSFGARNAPEMFSAFLVAMTFAMWMTA
ncbi:extracellular scp domain protein [Colletotrichum truncatum]|uniref:Extracellular scp domain protein n=1 Tax=Colletotrichum truncatum TaxID=5467 RepID=A0ACC3ZHE1_COLTU|nr:extracellular scp domain protein [Colletotrichum truncatum]KAF6782296.1 extracellular scp domain protein [Colletotrichum truncatum]